MAPDRLPKIPTINTSTPRIAALLAARWQALTGVERTGRGEGAGEAPAGAGWAEGAAK